MTIALGPNRWVKTFLVFVATAFIAKIVAQFMTPVSLPNVKFVATNRTLTMPLIMPTNEGWPIFAEWNAAKAKPGFSGNSISERYLDAFNARTDAYMQRIGARPTIDESVPSSIAGFVREL